MPHLPSNYLGFSRWPLLCDVARHDFSRRRTHSSLGGHDFSRAAGRLHLSFRAARNRAWRGESERGICSSALVVPDPSAFWQCTTLHATEIPVRIRAPLQRRHTCRRISSALAAGLLPVQIRTHRSLAACCAYSPFTASNHRFAAIGFHPATGAITLTTLYLVRGVSI